jgi:hypothetical protein
MLKGMAPEHARRKGRARCTLHTPFGVAVDAAGVSLTSIALDDTSVYFLTLADDGALFKVTK